MATLIASKYANPLQTMESGAVESSLPPAAAATAAPPVAKADAAAIERRHSASVSSSSHNDFGGSRRHSLPGSSEGVADGGVAFSSLPIDTGGGTTAANGGIKTAQKAPVVNGGKFPHIYPLDVPNHCRSGLLCSIYVDFVYHRR